MAQGHGPRSQKRAAHKTLREENWCPRPGRGWVKWAFFLGNVGTGERRRRRSRLGPWSGTGKGHNCGGSTVGPGQETGDPVHVPPGRLQDSLAIRKAGGRKKVEKQKVERGSKCQIDGETLPFPGCEGLGNGGLGLKGFRRCKSTGGDRKGGGHAQTKSGEGPKKQIMDKGGDEAGGGGDPFLKKKDSPRAQKEHGGFRKKKSGPVSRRSGKEAGHNCICWGGIPWEKQGFGGTWRPCRRGTDQKEKSIRSIDRKKRELNMGDQLTQTNPFWEDARNGSRKEGGKG